MRHLLRRGLTIVLLGALLLAAYPATQALALKGGLWSKAHDMQLARTDFTLTALPDGTVFAFGGRSSNGLTPTGEIYDPQTNSWRFVLNASVARQRHTATLLNNGKVLIVGGQDADTVFSSAQLYDPVSGTWAATGAMATARSWHTATLLSNGKVLVVGGTLSTAAELYDPISGTWSPTGSLSTQRVFHAATLLPDGRVLVAGGLGPQGGAYLTSAEIYDPVAGTWSSGGTMTVGRSEHTATRLPNGNVLVTSDGSAELYLPATNSWQATGSPQTARSYHTATLLTDGTVLVAGTIAGAAIGGPRAGASTERYNPALGTWESAIGMNDPRYDHQAVLLADGSVLVAGGIPSALAPTASAERYAPTSALPNFSDLPSSAASYEAVTQLAARGIIRGYGDGRFGPSDPVVRAQAAAFVARAMGWDTERWPNPFPDQDGVDDELWQNVGALNHYNVARGFEDGTYSPLGPVTKVQFVSLVSRAMRAKGYFDLGSIPDQSFYPNVPESSGARGDLKLFIDNAGPVAGLPVDQPWADWDQPASREWCAQLLWQALSGPRGPLH